MMNLRAQAERLATQLVAWHPSLTVNIRAHLKTEAIGMLIALARSVAQEQRDADIAIVKKLIVPDNQVDTSNAFSNGTCKALLFVLQDTALVTNPEPER